MWRGCRIFGYVPTCIILAPVDRRYNEGMKPLVFSLVVLLGSTLALAQSHNTQLMTPPEYKTFLDSVELELPGLESVLTSIDPAKTNASYAAGTRIVQFRNLSLKQIGWAREYVVQERAKHTVSGEFALEGFIRGIFDNLDTLGQLESAVGVRTAIVDKYAPELSPLMIRISNDLARRIELLEKGTCP